MRAKSPGSSKVKSVNQGNDEKKFCYIPHTPENETAAGVNAPTAIVLSKSSAHELDPEGITPGNICSRIRSSSMDSIHSQ